MKKSWVNVAVFDDLNAGKTLEACLRNKGLDARTCNDKLLRLFLFLRPPQATFRVQVRKDDLPDVTVILDQAPDMP